MMNWYYVEKEYYDFADDIEGVNIHYVCTPVGGAPDWENQRATRYMPFVQSAAELRQQTNLGITATGPSSLRLRKKLLKLPQQMLDPQTNTLTNSYLLHYYYEIFQDGHRRYSQLYTEAINTTGAGRSENRDSVANTSVSDLPTTRSAAVKEPSK